LIRVRIQHLRLNTDPDPVQGFDDEKFTKNVLLKKNVYNLPNTYPYASIQDFQATEEAFSPQKRTSST
jgi:hypothetical protein